MSMRPMPCLRASWLAARKRGVGEVDVPVVGEVSLVGIPEAKVIVISSGSLGAERMGSAVSFHCDMSALVGEWEMDY